MMGRGRPSRCPGRVEDFPFLHRSRGKKPKCDPCAFWATPRRISRRRNFRLSCARLKLGRLNFRTVVVVDRDVITVHGIFQREQRRPAWTRGAWRAFEVLRLVNEPTAAALAYGYAREKAREAFESLRFLGPAIDISILKLIPRPTANIDPGCSQPMRHASGRRGTILTIYCKRRCPKKSEAGEWTFPRIRKM